jgi:hypothetical protein
LSNYWHEKKKENSLLFSIVPYLDASGKVSLYENKITTEFGFNRNLNEVIPERRENDIQNFSKKSRLRLFNLFTSLNYSTYGLPLFVSATWHFDSPSNRKSLKQFLEKYTKRLKRNLPPHHIVWKFEYQKRGVPHFHFMLLPLDKNENFLTPSTQNEIRKHWLELKLCKCKHCTEYAIDIKKINEFKHAMIYISKELAKVVYDYEDHNLGRIWGSSRDLRTDPRFEIECTYKEFRLFLTSILEKKILNHAGELQLIAMKDYAIDSNLWISFEDIKIEFLEWQKNNLDAPRKKYSDAYKKIIMRKYSFSG